MVLIQRAWEQYRADYLANRPHLDSRRAGRQLRRRDFEAGYQAASQPSVGEHLVSSTSLVWAIRYCLSRRSYAFTDALDLVVRHWEELGPKQDIVRRDVMAERRLDPQAFDERCRGHEVQVKKMLACFGAKGWDEIS